jgi:hypothetical protein
MFIKNDLVVIKPEFLEVGEAEHDVYIVLEDQSPYGSLKITPNWDMDLVFKPIQTMKAECFNIYKKG